MLRAFFLLTIICLLPNLAHTASTDSRTGPKAYLPEYIFEFQPVPEGVKVVHNFVLYNHGNEPLDILGIKSAWGCTAATSTRQILPGEEGQITVSFNTSNYGGRQKKEIVRVQTNDPQQPLINLVVTGKVVKFAEMCPKHVRLESKVDRWDIRDRGYCRIRQYHQNAWIRVFRTSTLSMVIELLLRCFSAAQDFPLQFLHLYSVFFEFF